MSDRDLAVLNAVRDAGLTPPALDDLHTRVGAVLDRELSVARRRSQPLPHPRLGTLATALGALLAIAILVGALALIRRGPTQAAHPASAQGLIAKLAVLRRPQTAADVLPAHLKFELSGEGTIIPSLTRLVAMPPGARLYLAVTTPPPNRRAIWSPSLGDHVSIVDVVGDHATQSSPIPAIGLDDAGEVARVGALSGPGARYPLTHVYEVAVIPDGVARVRWTLTNRAGRNPRSVAARRGANVAFVGLPNRFLLFGHGAWYSADGSLIPTSHKAIRDAFLTRQNAMRVQFIRAYLRDASRYGAPRSLIAHFAVFSVTSRTGIRVAGGLSISHPALASLPFQVFSLPGPSQTDLYEVRQVTGPSGQEMWVTPGPDGLCIVTARRATFGPLAGQLTGAGGTCSPSLASVGTSGSGITSGGTGLPTTTYMVLPKSKPTLMIRTGPHSIRTIRPPYGVYIGTAHLVTR